MQTILMPRFRLRNMFLNEIHIKLDREHTSLKSAKLFIADMISQVNLKKEFKGLRVVANVDPM